MHKRMEYDIKQIKKPAAMIDEPGARLAPEEKAACRRVLMAHMAHTRPRTEPYAFVHGLRFKTAIIALCAMAAAGGVSRAAQGALPGDVLYPVKVRVNEPVAALFVPAGGKRADWSVGRVERRLEEVEILAHTQAFNAGAWRAAENNMKRYIASARNYMQELHIQGQSADAADFGSRLETVLKAHNQILVSLGLITVAEAVEEQGATVTEERAKAEAAAAQQKKKKPQVAKARIRQQLDTIHETIDASRKALAETGMAQNPPLIEASRKLDAAEAAAVQGVAKLEREENYEDAFLLANESERNAREANILFQAEKKIKNIKRGGR
jgi:hypothetical protein